MVAIESSLRLLLLLLLARGWRVAGAWLARGWRVVSAWLARDWRVVGSWLARGCWRVVGAHFFFFPGSTGSDPDYLRSSGSQNTRPFPTMRLPASGSGGSMPVLAR